MCFFSLCAVKFLFFFYTSDVTSNRFGVGIDVNKSASVTSKLVSGGFVCRGVWLVNQTVPFCRLSVHGAQQILVFHVRSLARVRSGFNVPKTIFEEHILLLIFIFHLTFSTSLITTQGLFSFRKNIRRAVRPRRKTCRKKKKPSAETFSRDSSCYSVSSNSA